MLLADAGFGADAKKPSMSGSGPQRPSWLHFNRKSRYPL